MYYLDLSDVLSCLMSGVTCYKTVYIITLINEECVVHKRQSYVDSLSF